MTNERLKELLYKVIELHNSMLNQYNYCMYLESRLEYYKAKLGITDGEIGELDIANKCKHFPESIEKNFEKDYDKIIEILNENNISFEDFKSFIIKNI